MRMLCGVLGVVALVAAPALGQVSFSDDFESGLGAWTNMVFEPPNHPDNDTPVLFSATDARLGPNNNSPGSTSAGYYRDTGVIYDGSQAAWLQVQFPNVVAPGSTVDVQLDFDYYVYADPNESGGGIAGTQAWGVGNRTYLLTNGDYNNPSLNFDGGLDASSVRFTRWNASDPGQIPGPENGIWGHVSYSDTVTTANGNFELRLLNHDKFGGMQAVAWDNVVLTITPEPSSLALLALGVLPLLWRRRR